MKKERRLVSTERKIIPYIFISPNLLIFTIFIAIPAVFGLLYSFTNWSGAGAIKFIGFQNYTKLFSDRRFWKALRQTVLYSLICMPVILTIPLFLAQQLIKNIRCRSFFRAVYYWPSMISYIVIGLLFQFIFSDTTGIINYLLNAFGKSSIKWLTNANNAMFVVVISTVWSRTGFYMVMYISGLQSISPSLYEAAEMDGASRWQQFCRITLPLLKPTTFMVLILGFIDLFKTYGLVKTLTNGGPAGATKFVVQYIYEKAFTDFKLGYACACSMVLLVILVIFTLLQFSLTKGGAIDE